MRSEAKAWNLWFSTTILPVERWKRYLWGAVSQQVISWCHTRSCAQALKPKVGILPPQTVLVLASFRHASVQAVGCVRRFSARYLRETGDLHSGERCNILATFSFSIFRYLTLVTGIMTTSNHSRKPEQPLEALVRTWHLVASSHNSPEA